MMLKATNPFSSCFLKPGANTYLFDPHDASNSIEDYSRQQVSRLVSDLLYSPEKRLCIVGPHGTGKSTLLVQIVNDARITQLSHARIQLSSESRNFSELWAQQKTVHTGVFAVDGYEQLGFISKIRLLLTARKRQQRLVVTAHVKPRGFKVLHQTARTQEMDAQIVYRLLGDNSGKADELLQSEFWQSSQLRHAQNLRESLFDAYDWYEQNQ